MTKRIATLVAVAVVGALLTFDLAAPASADEALAPATEYVVPGDQVFGIAFGPDGALWSAESSRGIVGTVSLPTAPSAEAPAPLTIAPRFTG